jgi:DNA-directed RNA polymerase specialized sigma24 family protein
MYSLYLQGFDHRIIAKELNKSLSQVNVEIYRINQKIKKYDTGK